jgi:ATP-dependent DNA ligase
LNFKFAKNLRISPATTDDRTASKWFKRAGGDLDGIIAKRLDAAYASGERTAMVKIKPIRTADCVVGGFRYARGTRVVGSLLLGLYGRDGLLHHVGFTSAFTRSERRELTKKFEALKKPLVSLATHLEDQVVGARIAPANGNQLLHE